MPTRLLLEGPDIEELLARVRDEHGGHARIVSAEKIRTGGLGGFFAKQRFELAVELDDDEYEDDPATARTGTATRREPGEPTSVQDLIAMVEARETGLTPEPPRPANPSRGTAAGRPTKRATASRRGAAARDGAARDTASDAAAGGAVARDGAVTPDVAASDATPLDALTRDAQARDALARDAVARDAVARDAVARDAVARDAVARDAVARDAVARDLAAAWDAAAQGAAARDALARDAVARDMAARDAVAVRNVVAAARIANGTRAADPPTVEAATALGRTDPSATPHRAGAAALAAAAAAADAATNGAASPGALVSRGGTPTDLAGHGAYPVAVAPAAPAVPGTVPGTGVAIGPATIPMLPAAYRVPGLPGLSRPAAELLALGVPEALAIRAVGADRYAAVLAAVASLPAAPPPPDAAGEILALVGDVPACTALGEALSELQYLDGARVLVAGPVPAGTGVPPARRILGPDDAARRAGKLRAGETPRVVAVAAPVDGRSAPWARSVLAALRPTATWALVDATRKITDTARHLVDLGRLDALAVHSAAVTADPGSILTLALELGVPIVFLDGRPATADEWASLLCARMGEP